MHMSTVLSANVLHRDVHGVEARIAIYDDPSERQRRRLIGVDAILKKVSVHECKPLDQATLAALVCRQWRWACCPPTTGRHAWRQRRGARPFRARVRPGDEQNRARQCRARLARRPRGPITIGPSASTSAKRRPSRAEPGMTRAVLAGLLVALLSAMPAAADNCPPGQFFRVRLNQCVGLNTRLASAYVHAPASRAATPGSGDRRARGETCRRAQDCHPVRFADAQ